MFSAAEIIYLKKETREKGWMFYFQILYINRVMRNVEKISIENKKVEQHELS